MGEDEDSNLKKSEDDKDSSKFHESNDVHLSPLSHKRLPWEFKSHRTQTRCDNLKSKRRKFVVLKTSKLKAFALMFTLLALVILTFQVNTTITPSI